MPTTRDLRAYLERTKEQRRQAARERYHELKRLGICTCCGSREPRPNRTRCEECAR